MRVANWIMTVLFVLAAAVQYNDPDPVRWIAIYGGAAVACRFGLRAGRGWVAPALVALAALAWIVTVAPSTLPHLVIRNLVRPMQENVPAIEESRELFGLVIVAAWMILLLAVRGGGERARRTRP